jgi:glycosyltransferase involved in cell wall biosynthesis
MEISTQGESRSEVWVHIPFPGDHYSGATGSAAMAVVYELNRRHESAGGQAQVIVGRGTRHDYPAGQCIEVDFPTLPNRRQKLFDASLSRLRLPRLIEEIIYRPASAAIAPDFDGPIFVNNAPGALRLFKKQHPQAQVCLYAVNALFRTYTRTEVQRTLGHLDRVICCSHFIANDLRNRLGHDSPKIQVVHNGVDVEKFCPVPRQDEVPTILFVGRAVPEKGPDLLLRAAGIVLKESKTRRFKLRIVGSAGFAPSQNLTPYESELRRLAEPLHEVVEFQASVNREQLLREYQAASIFCAPSNWDDPFPLTVLEAMSCGLPVVSSRRGGIPEGGGDDIFYFQPPEVDELAAHLIALVDDPELRATMGARARQRVQRFAWENQYQRLREALALPHTALEPVGVKPLAAVAESIKSASVSGIGLFSGMGLLG